MSEGLAPGLTAEMELTVTTDRTADAMGNPGVHVFASRALHRVRPPTLLRPRGDEEPGLRRLSRGGLSGAGPRRRGPSARRAWRETRGRPTGSRRGPPTPHGRSRGTP